MTFVTFPSRAETHNQNDSAAQTLERLKLNHNESSYAQKFAELVWDLNSNRRQLTDGQRAAAGANMESFIEATSKKALTDRARSGGKGGKGKPKNTKVSRDTQVNKKSDKNSKPTPKQNDKKRTTSKVADKVKSSSATVARARAVKKNAPDLFKEVEAGRMKTGTAYNEMKKRQRRKELEDKAAALLLVDFVFEFFELLTRRMFASYASEQRYRLIPEVLGRFD